MSEEGIAFEVPGAPKRVIALEPPPLHASQSCLEPPRSEEKENELTPSKYFDGTSTFHCHEKKLLPQTVSIASTGYTKLVLVHH